LLRVVNRSRRLASKLPLVDLSARSAPGGCRAAGPAAPPALAGQVIGCRARCRRSRHSSSTSIAACPDAGFIGGRVFNKTSTRPRKISSPIQGGCSAPPNGGYLILEARDVLRNFQAWESLEEGRSRAARSAARNRLRSSGLRRFRLIWDGISTRCGVCCFRRSRSDSASLLAFHLPRQFNGGDQDKKENLQIPL
jgi:hypothetical protein